MEQSLFVYIWRKTKREQIWILLVILVSMPFYFLSLDLPKTIVNSPIQGRDFPDPASTQLFLKWVVTLPSFLGGQSVTLFPGLALERWPYLVAMSLLFLLLVIVNGAFKWYINIYKGRLGERMLRRLRYDLIDRVLRFPPGQFRRIKASEVATMVKDEVEPLGGFIGDAFVQPMFLGGQALTAMVFILAQSLWLGLLALGIVAAQAFIIPRLRKYQLMLGKQRQVTARELAGRVGEIVDGIAEIRVNDASNYERADIAQRLGRIYFIRYDLYNRKFFVKFLNNFLSQFTPFLFYLVGGYFAIKGTLDIGQLTAVIAAYKDLPSPIKELIDWDQQRQDVEIKFTQVIEQFAPEGMIDPRLQAPVTGAVPPIAEPIEFQRLSITDDTGARLIESTSFTLRPRERVAAVGSVNAGAETAADALVRLQWPSAGTIRIGAREISEAPESLIGRRIAYVGPQPYFPNMSIRDCLLYGLRHVPVVAKEYDAMAIADRQTEEHEARASGNSVLDMQADWTDYAAAGVGDGKALDQRLLEVLEIVEMDEDVYQQGLRARLDPVAHPQFAERALLARKELAAQLVADPALSKLVETFNAGRYNLLATVAVNLLFGTAVDPAFEPERLPDNAQALGILAETGLDERLFDMGRKIAETVIELFGGLPPGHAFFEQLDFMAAEELPVYRAALARVAGQGFKSASAEDRALLLKPPLLYIETRHRLGLLDEDIQARIVAARAAFRQSLSGRLEGAVDFYDANTYNAASSLQDNIIFGRIAYGVADAPERIRKLIKAVLDKLDMRPVVYAAGLAFMVGSGGKRLTQAQRAKIALARALLKRPDLIIVNRGLSSLDQRSQKAILERVLALSGGTGDWPAFGLFWVLPVSSLADGFDRVLHFENGTLVEDGSPQALKQNGGRFAKLVA